MIPIMTIWVTPSYNEDCSGDTVSREYCMRCRLGWEQADMNSRDQGIWLAL